MEKNYIFLILLLLPSMLIYNLDNPAGLTIIYNGTAATVVTSNGTKFSINYLDPNIPTTVHDNDSLP